MIIDNALVNIDFPDI